MRPYKILVVPGTAEAPASSCPTPASRQTHRNSLCAQGGFGHLWGKERISFLLSVHPVMRASMRALLSALPPKPTSVSPVGFVCQNDQPASTVPTGHTNPSKKFAQTPVNQSAGLIGLDTSPRRAKEGLRGGYLQRGVLGGSAGQGRVRKGQVTDRRTVGPRGQRLGKRGQLAVIWDVLVNPLTEGMSLHKPEETSWMNLQGRL